VSGGGSQAITERLERTAQGYRRFRCRACGKEFNERTGTLLNRAQFPSDVIALVVLWRLRYKLSLRDLPEMFAVRGMMFSHEAVREWEAKLTPALAESLRRRRKGRVGRHWCRFNVISRTGRSLRYPPTANLRLGRPQSQINVIIGTEICHSFISSVRQPAAQFLVDQAQSASSEDRAASSRRPLP
jgi:hypothetical protein